MKTQFGVIVSGLRTDSASEYVEDREFVTWLFENTVKQQASCPHAQYQNGYAERTMRTVLTMTAALMLQSGAYPKLWGYALQCVMHIWNRLPTGRNEGTTPYQMLTGEVPDINSLHPFGCEVIITIPPKLQSKSEFAPHGERGIFLGYSAISKGYHVMKINTGGIYVRAPEFITFNEEVFPLRSQTLRETLTDDPEIHQSLFPNPGRKGHAIHKRIKHEYEEDGYASDPEWEMSIPYWSSAHSQITQNAPEPSTPLSTPQTTPPTPPLTLTGGQEGVTVDQSGTTPADIQMSGAPRYLTPSRFSSGCWNT